MAAAHTDPGSRRIAVLLCMLALLSTASADQRTKSSSPLDGRPEYDVAMTIDFDDGTYTGTAKIRYKNRTPRNVEELFFNLYPNAGLPTDGARLLRVSAARSGSNTLERTNSAWGVRVALASRLAPGETAELELDFTGHAITREPAEIDLVAHVTDQVAVVLDPEMRRTRIAGEVSTRSADAILFGNPFPVLSVDRDSRWEQDVRAGGLVNADASKYRIAVRVEEGVQVVASGMAESASSPTERVFAAEALRSVSVFAARGFVEQASDVAGVRLASLYRRGDEQQAARALDTLSGGLKLYAAQFGEPPFKSITLVEAPLPPGHPSAVFSGIVAAASAYYTDQKSVTANSLPGFIRDTPDLAEGELEYAVLSGLAEQWWGEAVGSDPQNEAYLSEGLSAYSAIAALASLRGTEKAERALEMRLRTPYRVFRMFGGSDGSANRRAGELPNYFAYAATVQSKGGLFVWALRDEFGDDRFREGLRQYYAAGIWRIADSSDLRMAIVLTGNRTKQNRWNWLYSRWIEQKHGDEDIAAPAYSIANSAEVASGRTSSDPKRRGAFERFGRFIARQFAFVGKQVARPF